MKRCGVLKHGTGPTASTDTSARGSPEGRRSEAASLLGKHLRATPARDPRAPEGLSLSATVHGVPTTAAHRLLRALHTQNPVRLELMIIPLYRQATGGPA